MSASNLFDVLADAAERYGDDEFLIVGHRSEVASFRQLRDRAEACGRTFAALGARPGDRIAIWMTNRVDWAAAAYGAARCGAVTVGVNTRLSAREAAHLLLLTRPHLWVVEARHFGRDARECIAPVLAAFAEQAAAPPRILLLCDDGMPMPGTLDWYSTMADHAAAAPLPSAAELVAQSARGEYPELADAAVILSTSGTTAAPKGVVLGHRGTIELARAVARRQDLSPGQRFYSVGPFFHASGFMHALLANLVAGSTLYTSRPYNAREAWDILRHEAITAYHGSIVPLQDVALLPDFRKEELPAFSRAWYSAPAIEMARLEALYGTRMCEVYGLTETAGNVSICHVGDPLAMRHDSDGRPHDGIEVSIVDPETGSPLPDGTPGEIRVRGFNVMLGYFRDRPASTAAIDGGGWLKTGDQGVRLPGGFIKFMSRLKDVIRVGGENLSPLEVEEVLVSHPDVKEAAVVATPHPRLGEVPVAFLVLNAGRTVAPDALDAFCRERLANFKTPRRFIVVDDMPRSNAVNRVSKAQLREMLVKGEV